MSGIAPRRLIQSRSLVITTVATTLLAAGCSAGSDDDGTSSAKGATIALVAPITGPLASLGNAAKQGLDYWVKTTNDDGGVGGKTIKVEVCDSKGTPDGASQCARGLIGKADVYVSSGVTAEVAAVQAQLVGEVVLSISPNLTPAGDTTFFQVGDPVANTIDVMFAQAKEAGINNIGVLAATDASGEATIGPAKAAAAKHGMKVSIARIEPQDVAASGQLTQLQSDGVGLLYVSYSGAGAATVVQAYARLALKIPLVLNSASVTNEFLAVISASRPDNVLHLNQVGALVPENLPADKRERPQAFLDAYAKATGKPADGVSIQMQYVGAVAAAAIAAGSGDDAAAAAKKLATGNIEALTDITFETSDGKHFSEGLAPSLISSTPDGKWIPPVLTGK